jgi:hypothetical protein
MGTYWKLPHLLRLRAVALALRGGFFISNLEMEKLPMMQLSISSRSPLSPSRMPSGFVLFFVKGESEDECGRKQGNKYPYRESEDPEQGECGYPDR